MDDRRYTDIVSVDYRLRPEFTIDDSIRDCLRSVLAVLESGRVETVHLIGFSAGGMLCLQTAMIIEQGVRYYDDHDSNNDDGDENKNKNTKIFNVNVGDDPIVRALCRKSNGLWRTVRRRQLYLIAPLCRLDRLFVNRCYDVSHVLQIFSNAFFEHDAPVYDPLYNMTTRRLTLDEFDLVAIVDVCRNSLSNHAINLYEYLREKRTARTIVTVDVFDECDMHAKPDVLRQIRDYDLRSGNRASSRFVETELRKINANASKDRVAAITAFLVYHFFMYIVPCNASWKTLKRILIDPPAAAVAHAEQRMIRPS